MDGAVALALELGDEDRARRLFELLGAKSALREFRRMCAVRFAVERFRAGERDRALLRDRLMSRYGIGRRLAYECLDCALDEFAKLCTFGPRSCTQPADNASSTIHDETKHE